MKRLQRNPGYVWFPKDWSTDPVVTCSIGARGLWREMLDLMYLNNPPGYLEINGKPLDDEAIAKFCRLESVEEYRMLLAELQKKAGIPKRDERGVIYSPKLIATLEYRAYYAEAKRMQRARDAFQLEPDSDNGQASKKKEPVHGFEQFYARYPKKTQGPKESRRIWERKVKAEDVPRIMEGLERHLVSEQWAKDDGQYIPMPSTFLNQRRWEAQLKAREEPVRLKPVE